MKESLSHLPQRKRGEIARIVSIIRQTVPQAEMIILFGSYARGDAVEDVTVEGHTTYEYSSDFDILVIVKSKALADNLDLWYALEDEAGKLPVETPVKIIAHEINFVNGKLKKGQYFFSDIKAEGVILYDSKNCKLAEAKQLTPKERLGQAKADFKQWFNKAKEFYGHYELDLENKWYEMGAFHLHQAAECCYGTVLLVYTNYKPKTHDLDTLRRLAANHDPAFFTAFPLRTKQERDRFDLLRQAYVGARYHDDYVITPQELKYLARCVELLRNQTETSCETKMTSFI
ncbi:MAG: HEPN domain-containing protein [Planctomycetota bacterium]|jgi:HEPN domain-containing protein/predicted nucleotidyltransferase